MKIKMAPFPDRLSDFWLRSRLLVDLLQLILADLNVRRPRLLLDANSVDPDPAGSERSPVLRNPRPPVGGVQDRNQIANLERGENALRRHDRPPFVALPRVRAENHL